jgi:hypothetical protein
LGQRNVAHKQSSGRPLGKASNFHPLPEARLKPTLIFLKVALFRRHALPQQQKINAPGTASRAGSGGRKGSNYMR